MHKRILIILSLKKYLSQLSMTYNYPTEIIYYILWFYQKPLKSNRILEVTILQTKLLKSILKFTANAGMFTIVYDFKSGIWIFEKHMNDSISRIHIYADNIDTFFCNKGRMDVQINSTKFNKILTCLDDNNPIIMYIDNINSKIMRIGQTSKIHDCLNIEFSLELGQPIQNILMFKKGYMKLCVDKQQFENLCKKLRESMNCTGISINDNTLCFDIDDSIKYNLTTIISTCARFSSPGIGICVKKSHSIMLGVIFCVFGEVDIIIMPQK